jgi:hypothetical protein
MKTDTEEIYCVNVKWLGMAQHLVQWLVSHEYCNELCGSRKGLCYSFFIKAQGKISKLKVLGQ